MKTTLIVLALLLIPAAVHSQEYTVKPKYYVGPSGPHNRALTPGSPSNPYIIRDSQGREVGQMRSRVHGTPGTVTEPGRPINPFVIEPSKSRKRAEKTACPLDSLKRR